MFKFKEIVKTFILEFSDENEGELTFKVEISKSTENNLFSVDLYRRNIFSLNPNTLESDNNEDEVSDEILWTLASEYLYDDEPCESIDKCLEKVSQSLDKHFEIEK